ncbi:SDR family oxidoreductase [Streptosporangium sp. NPDC023963]|uniref:SDR family oxidoreductase n=1 Tax=Streptosporangium sp. NPDC023963 TaxID=3155608 RepID=UPI003440862D
MSMGELNGKVALVTGGARNVGKAIVTELARRGAHVIVNYFHAREQAEATRAELTAVGYPVDLIRASVARPEQVERMFATIGERHGGLDILVNNAASGALLPLAEVTAEHLDKGWDTNVKGALECARHALPLMERRGRGSIVNVSALGGAQFVMANYFACAPAKAAMEALTRYLAAEYAPRNIRVNTASAAMLVSEVADRFPDAARMQEAVRRATPMGRLGTPEEFAEVVAFLAGEQSRWMTGQVVLADGGLSLGTSMLAAPPVEPVAEDEPDGVVRDEPDGAVRDEPDGTVRDEPDGTVRDEPDGVAIVGMGLAVAGANSPEEYWRLRLDGEELFVPVPADRWASEEFHSDDLAAEDKSYQDRCVFITGFQPGPGTFDETGGAEEHELTTAWLRHSMVQAMREVTTRPGDRFSCSIGYTPDGNQHLEEAGVLAAVAARAERLLAGLDLADAERESLLEELDGTLAGRYRRGAGADPSRFLPYQVGRLAVEGVLPPETRLQMVDTACSSSLYAVDIEAKTLLADDADVAVCGGAFALGPRGTVLFSKLQGLSKRGEVRALDADADGVIFADGAAVVVLKRLSRARADGDRIHGIIRTIGTSSDGKGKAVYAPNPDGQALAMERARPDGVDWIIAHATGTPAGDLAEFTTLRGYHGDRTCAVTSNKSLVGHTGWAAGLVSVIEGALGMRHETIAPQFRFTAPPEDFRIEESGLYIPTEARHWPARPGRRRALAVSGFGFGGTNAHLVVDEPPPAAARTVPAPRADRDRLAIVGWAAHLPGLPDRDAVTAWLRGDGAGPDASFGDVYPVPGFEKVRLPPRTVRTIDRCQLMVLECGHQLQAQLGGAWTDLSERTAVFVGHLGPTRAGMLYANRCYLDSIDRTLSANPRLVSSALLPALVDGLREDTGRLIPPANEDSFPGMMPNIVSARVANYFGFHGPNLVIDSGLASALSSFDVACRYLRTGDVDLALVGGINGNNLPELLPLLVREFAGAGEPVAAEGAFLFAITRERVAAEAGLPVLGWIDTSTGGPAEDRAGAVADGSVNGRADTSAGGSVDGRADARTDVDCGAGAPDNARYLGASGGMAILRALHSADAAAVRVACSGEPGAPAVHLTPAVRDAEPVLAVRDAEPVLAAGFSDPGRYAPGAAVEVRRHVPELVAAPASVTGECEPFLPDGVLVLVDRPELAESLSSLPPGARVVSCAPLTASRPGWHHLAEVTAEAVDAVLGERVPSHVRVLADLTASAPPAECVAAGAPGLEALHELTFLVLRRCPAASVTTVLLGAVPGGVPHPYTGLFSGLTKVAHLESPDSARFMLATGTRDVRTAVRAAERESGTERALPVVFDVDGERRVFTLVERPAEVGDGTAVRLTEDSVVLAVGGARGITAELMKALAERFRPRLYLVGSNPIDDYPPEVFEASEEEFAAGRKAYLRAQLGARPGTPVGVLSREYDRMADARAARGNLDVMIEHCGPDRVRYLTCDVTDPDAVRAAVGTVLADGGHIDLLVNAAGRNGSALMPDKDLGTFRAVRDLKLVSHRNLKRALAGRPPGLWCSFGSLLGFFGQRGEADYASGNDHLAAASAYAAAAEGAAEVTLAWTLWGGVGMGASPLVSDYYERRGFYTPMTAAEGVHHFVRELHTGTPEAHVVYLGEAERRTVGEFYPAFFAGPESSSPFYLRRLVARESDAVTYECRFDLSSDGYLRHHAVNGHPTLPGTFITEIAAEAARSLRPGLRVIGFTDLRFERFLRIFESVDPVPKRIHARVAHATGDLVTVDVRLVTDVVAPGGVVLSTGSVHFSARVLLAATFGVTPRITPWAPDAAEVAVPDPYHVPNAPVLLTGPFVTTAGTRLHPRGKRARFAPSLRRDDPVWSRFAMPSLLLDGMARMGVLNLIGGHLVPVAAPLSIRRIDLYQEANDLSLAGSGPIELYATPAGFALETDGPVENRFVAARPDGRVVAQIKDITATVLGYLSVDTGEFHTPDSALAAIAGDGR